MPPANNHTLKPGQTFAGIYRVLGTLGKGGMGTVYEVLQTTLGKRRALKTLSAGSLNQKQVLRFQAEARVLSRFDHRNIVKVYDVGVADENFAYFVMDMLDGETLEERLKKGGLTGAEALNIFAQILSGLAYAHKRGVVHRDIKPSNIMLSRATDNSRLIKLLDFGIARQVDELGQSLAVTSSGEVVGSPYYMSPEQAQGKKVDARSDIYSAGCVLYEMLIGHRLFEGENAMLTIGMHLSQNPDRLIEEAACGNEDLAELLKGCLEKDPVDRFASVELVDEALALVESSESEEAIRARAGGKRKRARRSGSAGTTTITSTSITQSLQRLSGKVTLIFVAIAAGAIVVLYLIFKPAKPPVVIQPQTNAPIQLAGKDSSASGTPLWFERFITTKEKLLNHIIWNGKKTLVYHFPPEASVGSITWGGDWAPAQGDVTLRDIGQLRIFKPSVDFVENPVALRRIGEGDFAEISFTGNDTVNEDTIRHLDHLHNLLALALNGTAVSSKLVETLKSFPQLRVLELAECRLNEEDVLKILKEEPELLQLKTPTLTSSDRLLKYLPSTKVADLTLTIEKKSPNTARLLGEQRNLQILNLNGRCLVPEDLRALVALKKLKRLSIGTLAKTDNLVEELSRFKHLAHLKLPKQFCDPAIYNKLHKNLPHTLIFMSQRPRDF